MSKLISALLDQLAERLTALVAGAVSSRVCGLQAVVQAEQQSELEDLARQYETDGKPEIAATLRQRAARLTNPDLAGEASEVLRCVAREPFPTQALPHTLPGGALPALPEWTDPPPQPRNKRHASKGKSEHNRPELPQ
jgi:hypothetical protein